MFTKARIKLTLWYLAIIMTISVSFSAVIFQGVNLELRRRLNSIERRFSVQTPTGWKIAGPVHEYFIEDLNQSRNNLLLILVYTNSTILVVSFLAGFMLAGKTLSPIEEALNDQKRFIADASHELKTPLTIMQTGIEVALRDRNLSTIKIKEALKEALNETRNLSRLTNNLLTLSRVQKGGLNFQVIDIKQPIKESLDKILKIAKKRNIKIIKNIKSISTTADPIALGNMITILLDNAIKFSKKRGKILITTYKNNHRVIIDIKDFGSGIAPEDLPHIFDRFYRADTSRSKTNTKGFGLGLSIAKNIAKAHNGTIKVKSKLNKGSTFKVILPIK